MVDCTWDIFIAHAGADTTTAEELYDLLEPHCKVFLDSRCLLLGDDWDHELASTQRYSWITVVLVSSHTGKAYYEREEIAAAIHMAREDKEKHRLVPIFLDNQMDAMTIPYGLRLKHGVHLSNSNKLTDAAQSLLKLVTSSKGKSGGVIDKTQYRNEIKHSVLAELQSQTKFPLGQSDKRLVLSNSALVQVVGRKSIHIISCETAPHKVQIECSLDAYRKIHTGFLSGELDKSTGVTWSSISKPSNEGGMRVVPAQIPLTVDEEYEETDDDGYSMVCHMSHIEHLETEAKEAEKFVGKPTKNPKECRIYITKKADRFLYVHSNYIKDGCQFPTKIITDNKVSLFTLFINILFAHMPSSKEMQMAELIHTTDVKYFVNKETFPKGNAPFYGGAMNIEFVKVK